MTGATIFVLAGTNGAGKSSIGGAFYRETGRDYFNPDEWTGAILEANPALPLSEAQAIAWHENVRMLRSAVAERTPYAFETTLGGHTILETLIEAAAAGMALHVWYVGLDSPERHLARIASRVEAGGHDIDAAKVRKRYRDSVLHLIELLPHLRRLELFDNSVEADPKTGAMPKPRRVLTIVDGHVRTPASAAELAATPRWARPVVAAAVKLQGFAKAG